VFVRGKGKWTAEKKSSFSLLGEKTVVNHNSEVSKMFFKKKRVINTHTQ